MPKRQPSIEVRHHGPLFPRSIEFYLRDFPYVFIRSMEKGRKRGHGQFHDYAMWFGKRVLSSLGVDMPVAPAILHDIHLKRMKRWDKTLRSNAFGVSKIPEGGPSHKEVQAEANRQLPALIDRAFPTLRTLCYWKLVDTGKKAAAEEALYKPRHGM